MCVAVETRMRVGAMLADCVCSLRSRPHPLSRATLTDTHSTSQHTVWMVKHTIKGPPVNHGLREKFLFMKLVYVELLSG